MLHSGVVEALPRPKKIDFDTCIVYEDSVFRMVAGKPAFIGPRQVVARVIGAGVAGYAKVSILACSGANPFPVGSMIEKPIANLMLGRDCAELVQAGHFKAGGHLEGYQGGRKVILDDADHGGMAVGASHAQGGIKGSVGTAEKPIEFEGREIILTAPVSTNPKKYEFQGSELTGREIASKINQDNGGVSFSQGGMPCPCN